MMSSQSIQSHINPSFGRKMPLYDRTVSSKPKNMSDLQGKQPLQYGGACFPYDPRGKEAVGFTPWSNSKTSLLEDRSPVSHISGMGGQNRIIYRQDGNSSDEGRSSSLHPSGVKQGFKLYTKSPVISSPTAAGKKQKSGGESLSPPSENTVYLAIPEPVYRLNPCCNELGCVIGHRYSMDHSSQRIPHAAFEHEWPHTDAQYIERGKAQEALLQQKHFERSAEALKRIPVGMYSPSTVRTFPAVIDPSYSYPFTLPPHALFGPLSEQSHRLHTSPRGYPSFYPSHPAYEQMTSEVYQEHSHMPKYGPLTQHPVFYYPQANVEVESRAQCKDIGGKQREDVPVLLKSPLSNNRERYVVPQPLHREIPLPLSEETLHNHSFMRAFDHQAPGFYSNSSQIRELLNSNRSNVLPGGPYVDPLKTNLRKDKPTTALPQTNPPFLHVDQTCSPRRTNQPGIPPSSIPVNRFLPPFAGIHIHRPILPLTALNTDKLRDYPTFDAQVTCPVQVKGIPVSPQAWLPQSPQNTSSRIHTTIPGSPSIPKIIYSPAVTPGRKENCPMPSPSTVTPKACLKRSISHSCSPARVKEEERELCEVGLLKKRPKVKMESVLDKTKSDSHRMPVIDNVFSLAPHQAYLQAPGLLFPGRLPQRIVHTSEHKDVKSRPDLKERRLCQDERQPETCPDTREENVEVVELKNIKVEKLDPSETSTSVETRDCSNLAIKKEREDACSSNREPVLVIKKVDPDELEAKPSQKKHRETLNESSKDERVEASDQKDASKLQESKVDPQVASKTESQLPESRLKFTNIPPHCLKLSNYKIFFHATNQPTPVLPLEKPPAQPVVDFAPKPEVQMPVRKHFFELHQSFCKLLSKTVQASSKQDLKAWLSKVELSERASPPTKVKRLSCLFGRKAREAWLNDEMKLALHKLLERLREYTAQDRCPFPHVMRAGAVFLPMLVVKELLFPAVQGSFIDQVLQEHKVELRPTTLSEEKTLIQLHKRACSSRLRRLMSLKHLPEIYADVVSLMYYTSVCKHLGEC